MKFSRRISIFLLIGIFLLACEEEQQAWLSEMEGTMTFSNNPNEAGASLPVTFSIIGGISTPGNVAYTWSAPGFGPSTFTGSSFETVAPITAGTYSIIVTAKAAGYRDVTCTQVVTVKSCTPMQGTLAISNPGNVYKGEALSLTASGITLPAGEHITYEWVAPDFSESYTAGSPAYTATAPGIAGTYSVSLTAEAAHYCPITIQDTIQVLDGRGMSGELRIIASDETVADYEATLIASGPTTPDNKEVTYEWYPYPGLTQGEQAGNSYTIHCPVLPGTYSVGVTARAEGYSAVTTAQTFTVVDLLRMAGTLTFNIPPEVVKGTPTTLSFTNSINKPSAGVSFTWSAPGFTPSTGTGDTLRVTPSTTGTCPITVTAKATKFRDTTFTTLVRVQDGLNMAGTLTFTSPKQGVKSQSITFSNPQGITTPDKGITYTWEAPHFDPSSATGNNYTAISSATGTFRVKLTASANNYISTSVVKDISVGDVVPMTGGLTITVPERVTVSEGTTFTVINDFTDPTSGITFEWAAPLFSPETHTGTSFPTVAPDMEGPAVVSVTAKAKGYQDKKINVPVEVKGKWKSGVPFNIEGPGSTPKDMGATFTANSGLTAGTASITYEWSAPGFNPNSHTGETFAAVPVSTGTYTITLKAKAPGYADNTVTKTVDVVELEMDELTGINASSHTFTTGQNNITFTPITAPLRSPAVYTWSTTGSTYTSTGNSYTPTLPSTEGNYVIMLLVKATGYKEKQVTFPYTATCHPMEVSFTSSRTALLTNDETTLNVNPPSPPVSGISYTWVIPTGFDVKSGTGDLTTPSVTIKTPNQSSNEAVPIKLTATAVNYCPATYSKNVTVKECYDLPNPPVITSSISPNNDGYVTVPSRRIVTFSTPDITPRRAGGAVTYNWNFDQDPMPFTPSSLTGNSSSFVTTAPAPNDGTYTLALQVKADGYCDSDPVTQKVTIASYITSLRGRLYIKEAIKTTNPDLSNQDSTIWIAQNQSATLTAIYIPASGEDNLDLRWKWSWLDGKNVLHSLPGDKNTIGFTPTGEVDDQLLTVEVYDFNGGAPISKTYRYTVQPCGYNKPDLHININYRCGKTTGAKNDKAFIRDPEDDKIYPVVKIRTKWWFADNLKKETGSYVSPASFGLAPELGLYYITGSAGICPAGWELPDTGDWNDLKTIKEGYPADQFKLLATNSVSGGSTYNGSAWAEHDNTPGSDYYGFSAKPAGYISGSSPATQGLRAYFLPLTGNDIYYLGRMAVELKSDGILGSTSIVPSSFYTARCVRSE